MDNRIVDLHVHSTHSDGTFTPTELVAAAVKASLAAFALTDHDSVSGVAEASLAAKRSGIELIPGVELSTDYHGREVHVVGLFVDYENTVFTDRLNTFKNARDNRNIQMVENLKNAGLPITMESLYEMFPDTVVTRAHIARFLLNKGCIRDIREAFSKYIGDDCRYYVPRTMITPMEAADLIRLAGGIPILAHPILYHMSTVTLDNLLEDMKAHGLAALEAVYSTYTPGEELLMKRTAKKHGLLISGGSDFHGANKPMIQLGSGKGSLHVPYSVLEDLKAFRIEHSGK